MGFPLNSENNTLISRECKRMRGVVITFRQLSHYVWVRHAKSLWCSIACCKTQSSPKKCIGLCIPLFRIRKEWEERKSKIYIHVHTNIKTLCTKYIYICGRILALNRCFFACPTGQNPSSPFKIIIKAFSQHQSKGEESYMGISESNPKVELEY